MPIRICSAINGFRRAGMAHPNHPVVYADDFFSPDQLEQLKAEPRIAVEFINAQDPTSAPVQTQGAVATDGVGDDLNDAQLAGVVDADGNINVLAELTVPELRDIAEGMGINIAGLKKDRLIDAIEARRLATAVSGDEG